jgi:8-oxo-dGTP diphosphatase
VTGTDPVLAAGGVVWRRRDAALEVVLVHRPRYDDWTFPKGKLDAGETDEEAAKREVMEEASLPVNLGPELPSTTYLDKSGKHKRVRYWAMTPADGSEPTGANEVDEARWVRVDDARSLLTYPRDVELVDALASAISGHVDR